MTKSMIVDIRQNLVTKHKCTTSTKNSECEKHANVQAGWDERLEALKIQHKRTGTMYKNIAKWNKGLSGILAREQDILYCFPNDRDERYFELSEISDQCLGPTYTKKS